ncbi:hypothetical protein V3C99_018957 [Haemonchus contortus]
MGCDLSTANGDSGAKAVAKVAPAPAQDVNPEAAASVDDTSSEKPATIGALPGTSTVQPTNEVPMATEEDKEKLLSDETSSLQSGNKDSPRQRISSPSSLASVMSVLPSLCNDGPPPIPRRSRAPCYTIDTSRSNTNKAVVSLCSALVGILEYPNGRDDNQPCDIYWHSTVPTDMKSIVKSSRCRVNKFPGMTDLSKKVSLTHAIDSMRKIFPDDYKFYPPSFFLPAHFDQLKEFWHAELSRRRQKGLQGEMYFIVKPDDGAQGTGIYLINDPKQIRDVSAKQLVQEYVADPFLMKDQLKFDFRVYGVIKSINPLSIYVSREGMVRFCTEKYRKPTPSNFENLYAHLTNYSLNKANQSYIHSLSLTDQASGSKRLLSTVFGQMAKCGLRTKRLWHNIKIIIVKTVLAMLPELMINYEYEFNGMVGPQCFQIIGFDIIVREDGTPILLEVNAAPSLTIDHSPSDGVRMKSIVDELIKLPLVRDTLLLVTGQLHEPPRRRSPSAHGSSRSSDDLTALKSQKKPHLCEIFPNRYGQEASHLLFVDRAVYIFMQFANLRLSKNISISSLRRFVRDCGLERYFHTGELESLFADISHHYTGDANNNRGLPFHGFLEFLSIVSKRRYPDETSLQVALKDLLNVCASALRNRGVRSQRLRREEVETKSGYEKKIYMLPSHVRHHKARSKSCEPISPVKITVERRADGNNNNEKHVSLPSITRK